MGKDAIDRMLEKNFVKLGSPLERTARLHAYEFFGSDGSALEERFASFIAEQRQEPFYADSFSATPPTVAVDVDPLHLSEKQRADIDAGRVIIPGSGEPTASVPGVIVAKSDQEFDQLRATGKVR